MPKNLKAEQAAPLQDAFDRCNKYRLWFQKLPAVSACERMAADLGLPMRAAAGIGGNVLAGSFAKALENLRTLQQEVHSTAGLAERLNQLVTENIEFDGLPAKPNDTPCVRLMNLHKVKGLEAPVVFLADPTGHFEHPVDLYIDRTGDKACGYMNVFGPKTGYQAPLLACPANAESLFAEEEKFCRAERERLMYVAATRAGAALVVARRAKGNKANPWSFFEQFLESCPTLPDPGPQAAPAGAAVKVTAAQVAAALDNVIERWNQSATPSYSTAAAKELSLTSSQMHFHSATGEHGTEWGTVIHLLLEAALAQPLADLKQLACLSLVEEGLDPSAADTAVEMVQCVLKSAVFRRARAASRYLIEVPFQRQIPPSALAGRAGASDNRARRD